MFGLSSVIFAISGGLTVIHVPAFSKLCRLEEVVIFVQCGYSHLNAKE